MPTACDQGVSCRHSLRRLTSAMQNQVKVYFRKVFNLKKYGCTSGASKQQMFRIHSPCPGGIRSLISLNGNVFVHKKLAKRSGSR